MRLFTESFEKYKKQLFFILTVTFLWGMLAHAYCFFNNSVSHDSLNEFHAAIRGNDWKIQLGRFFTPIYRDLFRSDATMPWLIGVLSLMWIGLSVFFVVRLFDVQSIPVIVLTTGFFTANITVTATAATYIMDLDGNMFALLCAVLAVYCWKNIPWGELSGACFLFLSLGIYQAYLSVAVVLIILVCFFWLLYGEEFAFVFRKGLRAIGMLLLDCLLYFLAMKVFSVLSNNPLASGSSNSMDNLLKLTPQKILLFLVAAYGDTAKRLFNAYSAYPVILVKVSTTFFLLVILLSVLLWIFKKHTGLREKVLGTILLLLLPLGMNLFYVVTLGNTHDLMRFSIWLFYLLALLLCDWLVSQLQKTPWQVKIAFFLRLICWILVFLTVYGSVQFANGMYIKKDLEYEANLSMMTRVVSRMEDCDGYVPGETPVVFVGIPEALITVIPGFKEYRPVIGMTHTNAITVPEYTRYQAYFDYILAVPLYLADWDTWTEIQDCTLATSMPNYPAKGAIQMQEGILIVKFSDYQESS